MFLCHANGIVISKRITISIPINHRLNTRYSSRNWSSNNLSSTTTQTTATNPVKWKNQKPTKFLEKSEYIKQFDEDYLQDELKKQSDRIMAQVKIRAKEVKHIFFSWLPYVFGQRWGVNRSKVMQYKRLKRILADRMEMRAVELGTYNALAGKSKELTDEEILQEVETDHELIDEDELFKIKLAGLPIIVKEPMEKLPIFESADVPEREKTQEDIDEAHKRFLIADAQFKEIRDELRNFSAQHGDHYRRFQYYTGELKNTQDRIMYIAHELSEYFQVYATILKMRGPGLKKMAIQKMSNINFLLLLLLLLLLLQTLQFLSWNSLEEWNVAHAWTSLLLPNELNVVRSELDIKLKAIFQDSMNKHHHGVYVIIGEHGSGKTTSVEQAIADIGRTDVVKLNATADEEHLAAQLDQVFNKKKPLWQRSSNISFDNYVIKFCETCAGIVENRNLVRKLLQIVGLWPQSKAPILLVENLDSALVLDHSGTSQSPVLEKLVRVAHKIGIENNLCRVVVVATPSVLPHLSQVTKQLSDFEFLYVDDLTQSEAEDFLTKYPTVLGWKLESQQIKNITSTLGTKCGALHEFIQLIDKHKTSQQVGDSLINKALQLKVLKAHKQLRTVPPHYQILLKEWAEETKSTPLSQRSEDWIKAKFKYSLWDYQFVVYSTLLQKGIIKWNPVEKTVDFNTPLMLNTAKLLSMNK